MSDFTLQLSEWPAHTIARANSIDAACTNTANEDAARVRDEIIELVGSGPKQQQHLERFLAARLSLPHFGASDTTAIHSNIERRLNVIAKAQRRVTLVLSEPQSLPVDLTNFLLNLVANTSLRVLLIGSPGQTEHFKTRCESAGLGWADFNESATSAERTPANKPITSIIPAAGIRTSRLFGSVATIAILCGALWYAAKPEPAGPPTPPTPVATVEREIETPVVVAASVPPVKSLRSAPAQAIMPTVLPKPPTDPPFPEGTRYTIQIASYKRASFRQDFVKKAGANMPELRSVDIVANGARKQVVTYGAFKGYSAAKNAVGNLPSAISLGSAYIIKVDATLMQPTQEHSD